MNRKMIKRALVLMCATTLLFIPAGCTNHKSEGTEDKEPVTSEMIEGGSHIVMLEAPYYHDFQDRLIRFLRN